MKNVTCTILVLLFSCVSVAHTGATGVVKERMDGMKDMSKKSKAVAKMFKGKAEFEKALVEQAADSFVMHSEAMTNLFPDSDDSRTGSKTEALPAIWEDWDKFEKYVEEFRTDSALLKEALASNDDPKVLKKAFTKAAGNCRQCHKAFRKPKR